MAVDLFALLHFTMTCLASIGAIYAVVYSRQASASSRASKRMLALETQIADLASSFDDLLESHKRLRSKEGMRELRERRKGAAPGATAEPEVDLAKLSPAERKLYFRRKHFAGMDHRAFALKMQSMDRADSKD